MPLWNALPALLDIRSPIVPSPSNPVGLVVAGVLLSFAIAVLGRMLWKRVNKS